MTSAPPTLAPSSGAKASNLALALGCLPEQRRRDGLVFYDFCRAVDDIADEPAFSPEEKRARLAAWKDALENPAQLPQAFRDIVSRHQLDRGLLREIILGMEMDIEPRRYATLRDLQGYCWRVASAVGLVSLQIFGSRRESSHAYAEQLGYALQLTNILRDVGEDARLGRIYLPEEDTDRFGVTTASLLAGQPSGDFAGLMAFEATRARYFFGEARRHYDHHDARALAPAEMMRETYEKLLTRMEADGFAVFERRYRLSKPEKLLILARNRLKTLLRPAGAAE